MNSSNKKPIIPSGIPQPFTQRAGHKPQVKPMVTQLKVAVSTQSGKRPVAPPVYKPHPSLRIAQPKIAGVTFKPHAPAQNVRPPTAPPVYRPQAKPAGVQLKVAGPPQIKKNPPALPVYRPQAIPKVLQPKKATIQQAGRKPAPLAGRSSGVVQRQYAKGTYVEVFGAGGNWYGVVTGQLHHHNATYRIRVGGTDSEVEVPAADVRLHPTISASPGAAVAAASRMITAAHEERRDGESVTTAGGTWTAVEYNSKMGRDDPGARGLHIKLVFTPNHTVDATNIVLVQTVTATKNNLPYFLDASVAKRSVNHVSIDQVGRSASPEYVANPNASGGGFGSSPVQPGAGEHGHRYQSFPGHWTVKAAWLTDNPHMREIASASRQVFETTAIAAAGNDSGRYYGSVRWGWSWSPGGVVRLIPLEVVTAGYGASAQFRESAKQWNATPTSVGAHPVQIPLQAE